MGPLTTPPGLRRPEREQPHRLFGAGEYLDEAHPVGAVLGDRVGQRANLLGGVAQSVIVGIAIAQLARRLLEPAEIAGGVFEVGGLRGGGGRRRASQRVRSGRRSERR